MKFKGDDENAVIFSLCLDDFVYRSGLTAACESVAKARLTLCDFLLCDPCDTLQRNTEQCCATCRAMRVLRSTPHTVRFVAIISVLRMRIK